LAFGDLYVVPFQLGWHWERTDLTTSYGFFAPTGKYEAGANDNIGLGMWSHEFSVGFTQYLDAAKTWHVATSAFYEVHTKKRDTDIRIGDLFVPRRGYREGFWERVEPGSGVLRALANDGRFGRGRTRAAAGEEDSRFRKRRTPSTVQTRSQSSSSTPDHDTAPQQSQFRAQADFEGDLPIKLRVFG
jgi:hypothetical protein